MPTPRGLVQRVDQSLHQSNLLPVRARLLVAVSGGADSVALLRLLAAINGSDYWGWRLEVVHVDHGIRGAASKGDAKFVRALARSMKLPVTAKILRLPKGTSEDAARQGRLAALAAVVKRKKAYGVVMAHHADDQAETVLLRIFRGAGLEGLAGMAAISSIGGMKILRPLLSIRRAELHAHLKALGQTWREDETNAQEIYRRNYLRNEVMPRIQKQFPAAPQALARLAVLAEETHAFVAAQAKELFTQAIIGQGKKWLVMRGQDLREADVLLLGEVLRLGIEQLVSRAQPAFERLRHAAGIIRKGHGGKTVELGGHVFLKIAGGNVTLEYAPPARRAGKGG